jgi:mono/diheme cytochrome c family protein
MWCLFAALAVLPALAGCSGAPAEDTAGCTEADRAVNWENFGVGFFAGYCRSCHSAEADDRYGAPEGLDFDSLEQVRNLRGPIHDSVLGDQTMPVGGGVDQESLTLLATFLECGL